jgi:hypothetical protein
VLNFNAGETVIDLAIFNERSEREFPRSPVDGRSMRRADLAEVQDLLNQTLADQAD